MAPAHEAVPSLVVVHGTPAHHTRWRPLLPYMEPHFTVRAIDRRGRGASGDAPDDALDLRPVRAWAAHGCGAASPGIMVSEGTRL